MKNFMWIRTFEWTETEERADKVRKKSGIGELNRQSWRNSMAHTDEQERVEGGKEKKEDINWNANYVSVFIHIL